MEIKTLSLDLGDKIDEKMIDAIMALDGRGSILLLEKEYEWRKLPYDRGLIFELDPEITIRIENGSNSNSILMIITTVILVINVAVVIWCRAFEVPRLLDNYSCEKVVNEMGRNSYPSKIKCS